MKVLFYAHVLRGLGHFARSLRIAEAACRLGARCFIATSGPAVDAVPRSEQVSLLRLPPLAMDRAGRCAPEGVLLERQALLRDWMQEIAPDRVLVDHLALGLAGELTELLTAGRARFVWGLPYAEPARAPRNPRIRRALAGYWGAVAYTEPGWCDPFQALEGYPLPETRLYSGMITGPDAAPGRPGQPPLVVGLTGGGAGGQLLYHWILGSLRPELESGRMRLRLVLGPLKDGELPEIPGLELWTHGTTEQAVAGASLAVARAGYNTAYSLVRSSLPVVLVPLETPESGAEQIERAESLARLEGIWCVREGALDPSVLHRALAWRGRRELPFRVDGAERVARWLMEAA